MAFRGLFAPAYASIALKPGKGQKANGRWKQAGGSKRAHAPQISVMLRNPSEESDWHVTVFDLNNDGNEVFSSRIKRGGSKSIKIVADRDGEGWIWVQKKRGRGKRYEHLSHGQRVDLS